MIDKVVESRRRSQQLRWMEEIKEITGISLEELSQV